MEDCCWTTEKEEKARRIIEHQFDLELLLKKREQRIIETEMARAEKALAMLRVVQAKQTQWERAGGHQLRSSLRIDTFTIPSASASAYASTSTSAVMCSPMSAYTLPSAASAATYDYDDDDILIRYTIHTIALILIH